MILRCQLTIFENLRHQFAAPPPDLIIRGAEPIDFGSSEASVDYAHFLRGAIILAYSHAVIRYYLRFSAAISRARDASSCRFICFISGNGAST